MSALRLVRAIVIAGLLGATAPTQADEIIEAPLLGIGDWWEFRSSRESWRLTVEAMDGDLYILSDSRETKKMYYMDRSMRLVKWVDERGHEGRYAALPYLRFPLDPRAPWRYTARPNRLGGEVVYTFTPKGWEEVDVGEHTVRALRIEVMETIRRGSVVTQGAMEVVWYSPEARQIVLHVCDCDGRPNWMLVNWGGPGDRSSRRGR